MPAAVDIVLHSFGEASGSEYHRAALSALLPRFAGGMPRSSLLRNRQLRRSDTLRVGLEPRHTSPLPPASTQGYAAIARHGSTHRVMRALW